ncbi:hypothetical protein XIS1_1030010 [Xenorhabdus innexi]|uniref:Uncharacterized protein n=1 Tax=Xenorhabdus innexi TaxID=290109 RepID=A0A1N6MQE9_9GAMM|nr:hypothetical protein XIS1_1030010 [Xenorhabdus innexi]
MNVIRAIYLNLCIDLLFNYIRIKLREGSCFMRNNTYWLNGSDEIYLCNPQPDVKTYWQRTAF